VANDALEESPGESLDSLNAEARLVEERRAKLDLLRTTGNAFPNNFRRDDFSSDLHRHYGGHSNEMLETEPKIVNVAGRMVLKRVMGKASFATIQDMNGRIQLYIARDVAGIEAHDAFKHYDLGDILGAQGTLFRTRTGELSVRFTKLMLLTKSLRPLPEKFHGLADQ
jgi:lysyl-tRNA synthetase class 2